MANGEEIISIRAPDIQTIISRLFNPLVLFNNHMVISRPNYLYQGKYFYDFRRTDTR